MMGVKSNIAVQKSPFLPFTSAKTEQAAPLSLYGHEVVIVIRHTCDSNTYSLVLFTRHAATLQSLVLINLIVCSGAFRNMINILIASNRVQEL